MDGEMSGQVDTWGEEPLTFGRWAFGQVDCRQTFRRVAGWLEGHLPRTQGQCLGGRVQTLTRMSRQAAFRRVIWSAMVRVVKPGSCLANSTVLMMHLVESSLNLSQRSMSRETRCSELLFWGRRESEGLLLYGTPSRPGSSPDRPALYPAFTSWELLRRRQQREGEEREREGCRDPARGEEEMPGTRRGASEGPVLALRPRAHPSLQARGKPYRSVFAQLAEGREGFLVRFSHLLNELPHLRRQRVALGALGLGHLLLLLVSVISHSCGGQRGLEGSCRLLRASSTPSLTESCQLLRRSPRLVSTRTQHAFTGRQGIATHSSPPCPPNPHSKFGPRSPMSTAVALHTHPRSQPSAVPHASTPAHTPGAGVSLLGAPPPLSPGRSFSHLHSPSPPSCSLPGGPLELALSSSWGKWGVGLPSLRVGGPAGRISWPISWGADKSPGALSRTHHSALKKRWGRYQPIIPDTQSLTGLVVVAADEGGREGGGGAQGGGSEEGVAGIIWRSLMSILQIQ